MSLNTFTCFTGTYAIERHPAPSPNEPLQAWDAADEYLLSAVAPLLEEKPGARVLIVNDQHGALAVVLHAYDPHSWGDSFLAQTALTENLRRNDLAQSVTFVPSTSTPPGKQGSAAAAGEVPGYDAVLWRVPKALAFFEQQLAALQPFSSPDTLLLAGGMVKHLPDTTKAVLGKLGSVAVLPVQKKAVLLRLTQQPDAEQLPPLPSSPVTPVVVPEYKLALTAGPNVFSHDKLDGGAHFLVEQFARLPRASRIADLGCGNGLLGIVAKRLQPEAVLHFFDESYQAVAAAGANYKRSLRGNGVESDEQAAQLHVGDGLIDYTGEPFDLVLCNPPFHQGHVISDQTAWQMFSESKQHLRRGGEIWIVGNRHLGYDVMLRRLFANFRQVAADPKFVVLAARKR